LKSQEKLLKERIEVAQTMINIVENLKKTRYRSLFILQTNLPFAIYRFEPSEYIELVEEGQKS
jgi:hypothetical protein